jgi:hypothetical protein
MPPTNTSVNVFQAFFLGGPMDGAVKEMIGEPRPIQAHKLPALVQTYKEIIKTPKAAESVAFETVSYHPVPFTLNQEDGQNVDFIVMTEGRPWSGCEIFQRMINCYNPGDRDGNTERKKQDGRKLPRKGIGPNNGNHS